MADLDTNAKKINKKGKDLQETLKELDKESNFAEYSGIWAKLIALICIVFSLFQIYTGLFGVLDAMIQRCIHLSFGIALVFLLNPTKRSWVKKGQIHLLDLGLAILSVVPSCYILVQYKSLILRAGTVTPLDAVMGVLGLVMVIEAARRIVGMLSLIHI